MNTFPGWRSVGHAMRWARQQDGITVRRVVRGIHCAENGWDHASGASVVVTHFKSGVFVDVTSNGTWQPAEGGDAVQVLRALAALDLIPDKQYGRCEVCDETCRWDDGAATWEHVKPLLVWGNHGPHPAEVAE